MKKSHPGLVACNLAIAGVLCLIPPALHAQPAVSALPASNNSVVAILENDASQPEGLAAAMAELPVAVLSGYTGLRYSMASPGVQAKDRSRPRRGIAIKDITITTHNLAHEDLGHRQSHQDNHYNIIERQTQRPRPLGHYYDYPGLSFPIDLSPLLAEQPQIANVQPQDTRADGGAAASNPTFYQITPTVKLNQQVDVLVDSAKLNPSPVKSFATLYPTALFPSLIPTTGQQWYGAGARTTISQADAAGRLGTSSSVDLNQEEVAKLVADLNYTVAADGTTSVLFTHAYVQLGCIVFGKGDTSFADSDSFPDMLNDGGGANGAVSVPHYIAGVLVAPHEDSQQTVTMQITAETPEASVMPEDGSKNGTSTWNSRSRFPDLAANVRWVNVNRNHLQLSGIYRDLGIEDWYFPNVTQTNGTVKYAPPSFTSKDVYGWGMQLTGVLYPCPSIDFLADDYVSFNVLYGVGIANYINDLRALGNYDAFFDGPGQLRAIPVTSYSVAYTHPWSGHWRSTLVYSEVDAQTFTPYDISTSTHLATASPYHTGRFASANLIYRWQEDYKQSPKSLPVPADLTKPMPGNWYTGIELVYGQRENVDKTSGSANRLQITMGVSF